MLATACLAIAIRDSPATRSRDDNAHHRPLDHPSDHHDIPHSHRHRTGPVGVLALTRGDALPPISRTSASAKAIVGGSALQTIASATKRPRIGPDSPPPRTIRLGLALETAEFVEHGTAKAVSPWLRRNRSHGLTHKAAPRLSLLRAIHRPGDIASVRARLTAKAGAP
jgi:hypothetical protein